MEEYNYRALTEMRTRYIFLELNVGKVGIKNRKIGWAQVVKDLDASLSLDFFFKSFNET